MSALIIGWALAFGPAIALALWPSERRAQRAREALDIGRGRNDNWTPTGR